jgi:tetratricopeptide (TPR) repeat protein
VAERQVNETKVALAVALDAIRQAESKGGAVRAYMNYAYVLRNISKHKSTRDTYVSAYEQAKKDFTLVSQNTEQVKYEYTAYLAKAGRTRECVDFLVKAAEELQAEADVLEAKGDDVEEDKKEEKKEDEESNLPGLTPTETEEEDANTKKLTPPQLARHFAMRNLLNAAGVLDTMGEHAEAQEVLANALELAINVHGENSIQHMNALYAVGVHCKTRGALEEAIQAHEAVLNIMDSTISVYEPDILQNRIAILRDTAILYDQQGHQEIAIDYAEGACVNAQTLAKIFAQSGVGVAQRANMMEQFWLLLSELKNKVGDTEGAAAARREALKGKLNLGMAARGGRAGGASAGRATHRRTGASTRAGGRRV